MPNSLFIIETGNPICPNVLARINKLIADGCRNILVVNTSKPRQFTGWDLASRYSRLNQIEWALYRHARTGITLSQKAKLHLTLERVELEIQLSEFVPRNPLHDLGCRTIGDKTFYSKPIDNE